SQFADGGLFATKPYVSGGNYINRMSDYSKGCAYHVRQKTGEGACPFNYLYWDFLARHEDRLADNHRLRTIYSTWRRMDPDRKKSIRASAGWFLKKLEKEKV
ncbi:MAG: cryptochrome/photolyase family protein, partial [Alphaproteobacteria bacterium]|nr:cryptochrome/photolyase family protein [Alphaproteobacteria bacterium]